MMMENGKRLATGLVGLLAVTTLAACGGGGGATDNPTVAVTKTFGVVPTGATAPTITYNSVADTFTVVSGSKTLRLSSAPGSNLNGFHAYTDGSANYLWASTGTTDATARFSYVDASSGPGKVSSSQYARASDGTVPTSGTASYAGNYGAVLVDSATGVISKVISGDLALTANFGTGAVNGSITNRQVYDGPGSSSPNTGFTATDVTLSGATLDSGGNFTGGTTSGGKISAADLPGTGSYEGLIGGTSANEVSGSVIITHDDNVSSPTTEVGAFVGVK